MRISLSRPQTVTMGTLVSQLSPLFPLARIDARAGVVLASLLLGSIHSYHWSPPSRSADSFGVAVTGGGLALELRGAFLEAIFTSRLLRPSVNWRESKSILASHGLHEFLEPENRGQRGYAYTLVLGCKYIRHTCQNGVCLHTGPGNKPVNSHQGTQYQRRWRENQTSAWQVRFRQALPP